MKHEHVESLQRAVFGVCQTCASSHDRVHQPLKIAKDAVKYHLQPEWMQETKHIVHNMDPEIILSVSPQTK